MLDIQFKTGNILKSDCKLLINPVNTVGVMGSGLAEQFRNRYPKNYKAYKEYCSNVVEFKDYRFFAMEEKNKIIFNFASKEHYSNFSNLGYIRRSLVMLLLYLEKHQIPSIAIPPVGCGLGGLDEKNVLHLIIYYLRQVTYDLKIELYQFREIKPMIKEHILKHYDKGYRDRDVFTGVGSRKLDEKGEELIRACSRTILNQGYILSTGDASDGCDAVFWSCFPRKRRFRFGPYSPVKKPKKPETIVISDDTEQYRKANHFASLLHPAYRFLPQWMKELHLRNVFQVLGSNLDHPTEFLLCWTPDGAENAKATSKKTGGTGTAIRCADKFGVPVFNLQRPDAIARLEQYLGIKFNIGDYHDKHDTGDSLESVIQTQCFTE